MFTKIRKRLRKVFSRNNNNVPFSLTFDDPTVWYQLTYVNLSNCSGITTLPKELGALPHLEKLVLSNNGFGASDEFKWHWLQPTAIQNNLRFLDLSKNSLTELPACIGKLSALTELIVCHNSLKYLPQSIGNLRNLKVLKLSDNKLLYLPGIMVNNVLKTLDVSTNADFLTIDIIVVHTQLLTLRSLAAKVILKDRSTYCNRDSISPELLEYLEKTNYCLYCKSPCFESYITKFARLNSLYVADMPILDGDERERPILSFECYFCSYDCLEIWSICNG
ncbi:uncharacterized protein LOC143904588 [Temnothorax americanus]|uniref:uncharacterized protein LOC143904588 n=1 Tax=Temnothorax americanus TaxID=1964332 RepID=UPI0040692B45